MWTLEGLEACYFSEGTAWFGEVLCVIILKRRNTVTNGRMSHILTVMETEIMRLFEIISPRSLGSEFSHRLDKQFALMK